MAELLHFPTLNSESTPIPEHFVALHTEKIRSNCVSGAAFAHLWSQILAAAIHQMFTAL